MVLLSETKQIQKELWSYEKELQTARGSQFNYIP